MEARETAERSAASPSLARSELPPRQAVLSGIDSAMTAALASPSAGAPASATATTTAGHAGFGEGTQALLDRLERLGEMRDKGLLQADEYETAKDAVMRELEARS
jgi:hypothetical protein